MKAIASALVQAQKAFGPALKTSTNPHFKSRYADLSACVEAVIDGLNQNGIALVQQTHECANGVIVETVFIHESGETYSAGKLHVPAVKQDAQGYGSALTYARRYSLMAACGIAPEDDDGNAAAKRPTAKAPADIRTAEAPGVLLGLAVAAANTGMASYQQFWKQATNEDRKRLAGEHERLKAMASDADKARTVEQPKAQATDTGEITAERLTGRAQPLPITGV